MFANLLTQIKHTSHAAFDAAQDLDFVDSMFATDLVAGDSAEFAAGLLYAYSSQTIDARDYLVSCST